MHSQPHCQLSLLLASAKQAHLLLLLPPALAVLG
jgi:hypothetical protein